MAETYFIIVHTILAISSILFFVLWRLQADELSRVKENVDLHDVIISAALGGYYCWDKKTGNEEFSYNLIKIFDLKKDVENFSQLTKLFFAKDHKLDSLVDRLKNLQQSNFSITVKCKVDKNIKHINCVGNRVDDIYGQTAGVVVWFYDVTEYIEEAANLSEMNKKVKSDLKDYNNIFNSINIPIWWRDKKMSLRHCNLAYGKVVNDDYADVNNSDSIPELSEDIKKLSQTAIDNNRAFNTKKHMVTGGERKYFNIKEVAVGTEGVVGYATDITEQEEIEKELGRHISAHADLLESSSSAMAIYGSDTKLKFYNNAFVKLWDFDEKWLNSNPSYSEVLEQLRERRKLPEQADYKKFRNEQMMLFKDLIDPRDEFFYLPDGKTLRVIVIPHALGGLLFAYEDMTDRFAMERSYNTLIEVQKETLDNLSEAIIVFGQDGSLKLYNPVYVQMWPDEAAALKKNARNLDLLNLSKKMFNYGSNWEQFKIDWTERPRTKKPIKKRVERTDGKVIDKLVVPLPDGNFLLSYQDVTSTILVERSLRERNEALEEADNLKTEFIANVSYELRTPLTSIMGFSEVLEEQHFGKLNKQQKEYVSGIIESSNDLMVLINDILDLATMEAGYMNLEAKEFDVYNMLLSLAKIMSGSCASSDITMTLECPKDFGKILGDEKRLKKVMFNIIGNSIKFTEKGGHIKMGAREAKKGEVVLWVEDDGIGVSSGEKKKVFDKFFKSSEAIAMKQSGTGLGLSVVKNIVELHGGRVKIESKEGEGTKILCYLKRNNKKLLKNAS